MANTGPVPESGGRNAGRDPRNLIDLPRSPFLSYYRRQLSQAGASPGASFPHKIGAFLSKHLFIWAWNYLKYLFQPKHRLLDYTDSSGEKGVYLLQPAYASGASADLDAPIRVALAGDWGTGTAEAEQVAENIRDFRPHYTIHLGDVYYVGDAEEVNENCLGVAGPYESVRAVRWPHGSVGSFAMNGNHEMYANGNAYFDLFLPSLGIPGSEEGRRYGQKASFFCLQNQFWRIIALDTGYNSLGFPILEQIPVIRRIPGIAPTCKLPRASVDWLGSMVNPSVGDRSIVLLTHHEYFSAFDEEYPLPAKQLAKFINRPVLWFWGHEHRFAIYGKFGIPDGIQAYGRCIGHGGFPVNQGQPVRNVNAPLVLHDDREYRVVEGTALGYNGSANLTFQGNKLTVDYRDVRNRPLVEESWESRNGVLHGVSIRIVEPRLSLIASSPQLAIS